MVTKEHLAQLRAERATPEVHLEHTPGGALEAEVKTQTSIERERQIKLAERAMNDAHIHMRQDQVFSSLDGLSTAHFNNHTQEIKP